MIKSETEFYQNMKEEKFKITNVEKIEQKPSQLSSIENELIILTKQTFDIFLSQKNYGDLLALYGFYYYTAKWQKTNQPKCTTGYVAKGLHWNKEKVIKTKKQLKEFGLIQDMQQRKNGKVVGWYIKITYVFKQETIEKFSHPTLLPVGGKNQWVENEDINALSSININALSSINKDNLKIIEGSVKPSEILKDKLNRIINNNTPIKKKLKLSYNEIDIFLKRLLNEYYESLITIKSGVKKENFLNEKELYLCQNYFNHFLKGFSKKEFPLLYTEEFLKQFQFPIKEKLEKGFNKKDLYQLFKNLLEIFQLDKFPTNKSKIPTRLSSAMYMPNSILKSYLLFYGYNVTEKTAKRISGISENMTYRIDKIKDLFFQNKNLTAREYNSLVINIDNLEKYTKNLCNDIIISPVTDQKYTRLFLEENSNSSSFQRSIKNFTNFFELYISFLIQKIASWEEFKIEVWSFKTEGKLWEDFWKWMKEEQGINRQFNNSLLINYENSLTKNEIKII